LATCIQEALSQGYVKIFRKVLDNPNASNPYFLAVWSYLLLKATHKVFVMRIAGDDRELNPGDLVCSCRQIAKFFNIDKDTINRILITMEKASMIRRKMYARKTVITVSNWASYQDSADTLGDKRGDTLGDTLGDTNKKKEERRYIDDSATEEEKEDKFLIASRVVMGEFNKRAGKRYKDHAASTHIKSIRARLEDGYTQDELLEVIDHKVAELKGTENEAKWLNPTTLFRPANIERNLDFARSHLDMEEAKLIREYNEVKTSMGNLEAETIRKKIMKIRDRKANRNGRALLQS
jgi:uncharacterized phage protein (TIGR02220 family)